VYALGARFVSGVGHIFLYLMARNSSLGAEKLVYLSRQSRCWSRFENVLTSSATFRLSPVSKATESPEDDASSDHSKSEPKESDRVLMSRICEGDKEALGSLFRRYAYVVRAVAHKVLRDWSEADDLLQDVFLLIYRQCGTYESSKSPVRFWILQITYCRAISRRRYLTSRHFYTHLDLHQAANQLGDLPSKFGGHQESMDKVLERRETLHSSFDELSESQRQTLHLFFFEGYTFEEIATKLGQTVGNAKNHYYRGLDKLRRRIFAEDAEGVLKS
jgi:RNA polymerase sigma-70 factor (ECF subfamily)